MKILFSDERYFDIGGVYNSQNDRVWAINHADSDEKGGVKQRRKHLQKVVVWLGACSKGTTSLVIFNEGTVGHAVYIEKVLPVALKYGNQVLDRDSIFQQDDAKPHSHYLTHQWYRDNFPTFINSENWLPNSPDLNSLDYSIRDEVVNIINWDKVKSRTALIQQIKLAHEKVRESVVFESCVNWTNRLYRMYQNDGKCLP